MHQRVKTLSNDFLCLITSNKHQIDWEEVKVPDYQKNWRQIHYHSQVVRISLKHEL